MPVTAKICGLSTPSAVTAALEGGASHLGFVFFPGSPRDIAPELAAQLAEPARPRRVQVCAVTVNPDDALIDRLMGTLKPDLIQLHGQESPARAREISRRAGVGLIKVLSVSQATDLAPARDYDGIADYLMFDAKAPAEAGRPGGAGVSFDWTLLAGLKFSRPWFLAGGLDPWNVEDAVRQSGAPLVDVSSGVERGAGLKEPALIMAFLDAVRRI